MGLPEPAPADLERARKGDDASFGRIVRLYQDRVYRLAWRMVRDAHEARDLAQEVFLRLWRGLDRYDPSRRFSPWFFRLALNVCLNERKRFRRAPLDFQSMGSEDAAFEPPGDGPGAAEKADARERADRVRDAILRLDPSYRAVISLRYLEDLSYGEVATILDLPLGTVKNRLFRARERLKGLVSLQRMAPEGKRA